MVSLSCSALSSSSFVQYIGVSSERKSILLLMQPLRGESKWRTRRFKAIDTTFRGVIPFSRSSTQADLLTSSARDKNRAHEFFLHLLVRSRPL